MTVMAYCYGSTFPPGYYPTLPDDSYSSLPDVTAPCYRYHRRISLPPTHARQQPLRTVPLHMRVVRYCCLPGRATASLPIVTLHTV